MTRVKQRSMTRSLSCSHRFEIALFMLAALTAAGGAGADAMRCGKWVVTESVSVDELVSKCGQPRSKEVTRDDIYVTNPNGLRVKTGDVTVTERWIYQRSTRSLPMVVVIVDGRIVSLTRQRL